MPVGDGKEFLRQCPPRYTGNRSSGADQIMNTVSEDAVRLTMYRIEEKADLE